MKDLGIQNDGLAEFCRRNHILKLSLFGSSARDEAGPGSDIDILVEYEPGHVPGLLGIARMESELATLFRGKRIDLRTPEDLSGYFRDEVVRTAEPIYAQG